MEEKVLVKSERSSAKILLWITLVLFLAAILAAILGGYRIWNSWVSYKSYMEEYPTFGAYLSGWMLRLLVSYPPVALVFWFAVAFGIFSLIFYFYSAKTELVITDKRAYGKTVFGKRVDLPLDAISAIGTGVPKKVTLSTASGTISFPMIKNADEIYTVMSSLLINRQK